ncbi:MAG: hypothetical protein K0R57_3238 [Paenibacillaceae bacterium]|jgi:hypothetical protein|nr:hypothetical protein [Paenibacillaceae bacterium]
MQKGLFTQGIAVLLSESVSIERIHKLLQGQFDIGDITYSSEKWAYGGPSFLIPLRTEVNGYVLVDAVDRPWPDGMGDPQQDARLFDAWSMGQFGPFAYPGNLERAVHQGWGSYPEGRQAAEKHRAFVRIRTSYILGDTVGDDAPILPEGYDARQEMVMLMSIAAKLLAELPEALCYFNPGGECLASGEMIRQEWEAVERGGQMELDTWSNVRMYSLPQGEGWLLMDTVGMWQLDVPDHEAVFRKGACEPDDLADFLRNLSLHFLHNDLEPGEAVVAKGPGGIAWQGELYDNGIAHPPRQVVRWQIQGGEIDGIPEKETHLRIGEISQ